MINRRQFLYRGGLVPLACAATGGVLTSRAWAADVSAADWIDESIASASQDSRVRTLVFHYTAVDYPTSLRLLTDAQYRASAHYLVPDAQTLARKPAVLRLVPEARRAWHAGDSYWQGVRYLNTSSIGIEIVNLGYPSPQQDEWPLMQRTWFDFSEEQIALLGRLASDIVARHQIPPSNVVGHADISPGRKVDPGPRFPWERLYRDFGIGAWPDDEDIQHFLPRQSAQPDVASWQRRLSAYGYDAPQSGVLDDGTRAAIAAFQMHFRPARFDGEPDAESSARLDALLRKYVDPEHAVDKAEHP
ncbi:N-acetylmuramoyl-L-alanine amidase [Chromobacterium sinusclupearum]|uniref:N-acetylmuramoyl-L-alanine amidase n=1 Tax=Chromobacterium sinusclupearum TaxID=2077146 RepID=A0A2K4MNP7_9NEIS|nr:N-acetylmuramoyl-L-alanine amidase [Chromobacterium sinusclupearum]POA98652.1 N-acetylmuramoyl-L-alanine amidase [Chromobacterium sinusclupearum]